MKELKDLKMLDADALGKLDASGLHKELVAGEKKLYTLRMKKEVGELKQTHLITSSRKYIAIINTIAAAKWFNIG